ncbi:hypothetical protein EOD41_18690 [Mucilaginibacter limnophilus]|uniref:Nucleoside phosphorylase domain-containing protein n=1 Tax=Mucilaginibacter limnophilus TaxID=1932778 RepID=A0A437MI49_9SPHI|nr:hypothetical protein [Mucilaginibacter limnophilus]RVT97328.1 hypothetical protein EOD41_18690 [Mucilaginibacter limnophilus]
MKLQKLMIIDDRIVDRKEIYQKVLSDSFELVFIEKASTLMDRVYTEEVDGYIVDIVLSNWLGKDGKRLPLQEVLSWIGTEKPIILLSNEYNYLVTENELTDLFNTILDTGYRVNPFFLWDEFIRVSNNHPDDLNPITNAIKLSLARHRKSVVKEEAQRFDLGVIAALGEELQPFLQNLKDVENAKFQSIPYSKGVLKTKNGAEIKVIAVQQEEMGTVDTAIISSAIVKEFQLDFLVMIGVCGGRDGHAQIGDIIIPNEIIAYQKGKIGENGLMMDIDISRSNVNLRMTFENKSEQLAENISKKYLTKLVNKFGSPIEVTKPKIRFHEMACGENVVNKEGELERIATDVKKQKLCAIDMETYSIYRLNHFMDVSTIVIKSVMDLSSKKSDKFKSYAAHMSANFLYQVLFEEILKV